MTTKSKTPKAPASGAVGSNDVARVRRLPWLSDYATSLSFSASRFFSKSIGLRYPSVE
jgi:hypothetical protein